MFHDDSGHPSNFIERAGGERLRASLPHGVRIMAATPAIVQPRRQA
jgi:hypothetical protein